MSLPSQVVAYVEVIHGDVGGVRQLVDLEGESVGVAGDEQDDDAHEDDRRFFATLLKTSKTRNLRIFKY
jgi:hypothetical protein